MYKGKKLYGKKSPRETTEYQQGCPNTEVKRLTEVCELKNAPISPKGNISAEFVTVPGEISFVGALQKVRKSIDNINFWTTDLNNQLVFLHESFVGLNAVIPRGTDKAFICSPKTREEIGNILKNNQNILENTGGQSVNLLFPRKNQHKSAPNHKKIPNQAPKEL